MNNTYYPMKIDVVLLGLVAYRFGEGHETVHYLDNAYPPPEKLRLSYFCLLKKKSLREFLIHVS